MNDLSPKAMAILETLISHIESGSVVSNDRRTYLGYKDVHEILKWPKIGGKSWGGSLEEHGLDELAIWMSGQGYPAITGMIVDQGTLIPGAGYFRLYEKGGKEADIWWEQQMRESMAFDWRSILPKDFVGFSTLPPPPATPEPADLIPPDRVKVTVYRVLRDTELARRVKELHGYKCQVCDHVIALPDGRLYAEAHHIQPLGQPHNGPDVAGNILCVCPNCHAELDYAAKALCVETLRVVGGHSIDRQFVSYHNETIMTGLWGS